MKDLNLTEEMVLLAVWKLKGDAYGVTIRRQLSDSTKRIFPYGTLYSALDKLARNGYVSRMESDPEPVRGGRSKKYYSITPKGVEALRGALQLRRSMWDGETEATIKGGAD